MVVSGRRLTSATFASRAYRFFTKLSPPPVPRGIHVMNPYADRSIRRYVRAFLDRYFADNRPRVLVFGINPGRFGAGITGITFTDPVALADPCGVANHLPRRRELSSIFIYDFIAALGTPTDFYRRYFLTAISPLGFTHDGTNLNYYDVPALKRRVTPFILATLEAQIALGARRDHAIVLGRGQNLAFLEELNHRHGFFDTIHGLEHPRWIMQYRRRQEHRFIEKYLSTFGGIPW